MPGMGNVHFPVTVASPEGQEFFDQGVAQLHTFYFFEAERSFRQVTTIDPDCPMAYWGLAMANENNRKRASEFLKKAKSLLGKATDRERKYIEALTAFHAEGKNDTDRVTDYVHGLEAVVLNYPDDIEAKAFLAWNIVASGWGGQKILSHVTVDVLLEDVLRKSPMHPGAHHYRIHLWDGWDPAQALRSAQAYAKAAPGIAHAWHMPGHIYNGLCRWRDAVNQQEAAARIDHQHMFEHRILPFQIHNYAHNQAYLIANLSHMGGLREGVEFARNLIETPRDPGNDGAQHLGRASLLRLLVRYERWDDILAGGHLEGGESREEQAWQAYARGFAHLGKGDKASCAEDLASLEKLALEAAKTPGGEADRLETARLELKGRLRVAEGNYLDGFDQLSKATKLQQEKFKGDLSGYPRQVMESAAIAHLEARDWGLAAACFRAALEERQGTVVSLAGLVEALERGGRRGEALEALAAFFEAWAYADQDLPYRKRLETLGLSVADLPRPAPDRLLVSANGLIARREPADSSFTLPDGPMLWTPSPAPAFELEDAGGAKKSLESLRGKYLLLSFYLGGACPHCVEQLVAIGKEREAWERLGVQVAASSDDPPAKSKELAAAKPEIYFPLLSDPGRKAAKEYGSHDTFEDLALHGLYLIDAAGHIRWSRVSAQPFLDLAFLKAEVERLTRLKVQ